MRNGATRYMSVVESDRKPGIGGSSGAAYRRITPLAKPMFLGLWVMRGKL